jgi:hypothetical protein
MSLSLVRPDDPRLPMARTRCLQNRVTPAGELIAVPARGLFLGNRGGRFHGEDRLLGARRWVSRRWICCRLNFKQRQRSVWGHGYTELFFLDEVTALAAGHRPCFECRRREAAAFVAAWCAAMQLSTAPPADEIDRILHAERLNARTKRRHRLPIDRLPNGVVIEFGPKEENAVFAICRDRLLCWGPAGYCGERPRPRGIDVDVLTPPPVIAVIAAGYAPVWHPSAECQVRFATPP